MRTEDRVIPDLLCGRDEHLVRDAEAPESRGRQGAGATHRSGRLTAVPGTTIGNGIGVDFGWWQAASGQLIAGVSLQDAWQVAVWRPGGARLYVAVTRAPADSWPVAGLGPY